jgi:hypothetical protein
LLITGAPRTAYPVLEISVLAMMTLKMIIDNDNFEVGRRCLIEYMICSPRICMEPWNITTKNFRIAGDGSTSEIYSRYSPI